MDKNDAYLMYSSSPESETYIRNMSLFKYLAMNDVNVEDFKNSIITFKYDDEKFLYSLNYIGMVTNINVNSLSDLYTHAVRTIESMASAYDFTFSSESEKQLIACGLAFRTFAFFGDYSQIGNILDDDKIADILNLTLDTKTRIYSMYYFSIPLVQYMHKLNEKNLHLYLKCIKISLDVKEMFKEINVDMIRVDERGYLINEGK